MFCTRVWFESCRCVPMSCKAFLLFAIDWEFTICLDYCMGVGRGRQEALPPGFWNLTFSYQILSKKGCFLGFEIGKMKLTTFDLSWRNPFCYPEKIHFWSPWKKYFPWTIVDSSDLKLVASPSCEGTLIWYFAFYALHDEFVLWASTQFPHEFQQCLPLAWIFCKSLLF